MRASTGIGMDTFESSDMKTLGWYSVNVLLVCLPIFLTFLAYTAILFAEVALKKPFVNKPADGSDTITTETKSKYNDPLPAAGGPNGLPLSNQPARASTTTTAQNQARNPPLPIEGRLEPQLPLPPTTLTTTISQPSADQPYIWEDLLLHMLLHIMSCAFSLHRTRRASNQNALPLVIAWIHFALISGYAFVLVILV